MVRVMIAGLGGIAPSHIEGFLAHPDAVRISVFATGNAKRAQELQQKYGLDCLVVEDYRQGLDHCDVVAICTPPLAHCDMALACLAAGKHVLLEKPMAPTLEECDKILQAAEASGKVLSVVAQSHFINSVANAIKLVKSGELGKTRFTSVNSCWFRGDHYFELRWRGRWATEGGGCTMSQAVHHIELLLWANGMPKSVTAVMGNLGHDNSEEEDISAALLQYADGSLAQLTCSSLHHGEPQTFNFQTERAGISIPFAVHVNGSRSNGFPCENPEEQARIERMYNALPKYEVEYHGGQIGNFLDAISGKAALEVDGRQGRAAIELITAIYYSAVTRSTVTLPLSADCGFYMREDFLKNIVKFHEKTRDVDAFEDKTITSFQRDFMGK